MNIVLIGSLYAPIIGGGAELVLQNQAEALAERGHAVHVLTLGQPGSGTVRSELNGVHVVRVGIENAYLPGASNPGGWERVAWHARDISNGRMARIASGLLASLQPDIVVCHNVYGWSAAVWNSVRALRLPLVQVLHDQYLRCVRSSMYRDGQCTSPCLSCRVMRLPHRELSRLPDAVVGVSSFVLDGLLQAGYFGDVPVRTHIHNASHLDTRNRATPARTGPEVVFGFIGSLAPIKGIEPLLDTFRSVAQPNWRLRVAGSGAPAYVQALRARHADARIEFLGRQDPASFYLGLDVTVVPSLWSDTLPSVVFESLVHGRPAIGSRRGGIPEMIEDGVSGLLYEPEEAGALAAVLARFASDVDGWRARNPAIKALAAPRYCDRDAWIARWEELLYQVARRKPTVGLR